VRPEGAAGRSSEATVSDGRGWYGTRALLITRAVHLTASHGGLALEVPE
jgi:hypothetical protein